SATEAISATSNAFEAMNNITRENAERLITIVKNVARLAMHEQPVGQRISITSKNIRISQTRELSTQIYGKPFSIDGDNGTIVTFYDGSFTQPFFDIQLIQWKQNHRGYSNGSFELQGEIISIELVDENGNTIPVKQIDGKLISIRFYSQKITKESVCRTFDEIEQQWKNINITDRQIGEWIECETPHLSEFAVFMEEIIVPPLNLDVLWYLMLLTLIPIFAGIVAIIIIIGKKI